MLATNLKEQLIKKCTKYLSADEITLIEKAVELSASAHEGSRRKSGEPYVVHPLKVALRLAELKLDSPTIIAAILHDTIEDTGISYAEIRKKFGGEVASLVEAVTKLGKIRIKTSWFPYQKIEKREVPEFERQIESLRKMLVAMSEDIRVILIKLADKIHNLETLTYLPTDKRERIAKEVIEIYAPIAERLGIGEWKGILEDLAFPYVMPEEYKNLKSMAISEINEREKYLNRCVKDVQKLLRENNIKAEIHFRAKKWYSLYKKLLKYDNRLDKIYDLVAIRIIVNSVGDCYKTLGIIHSKWRPLPGRIKDFIALPKPNGYQSIHTTIFFDNHLVEIQIKTWAMHYQGEFGVAAHWIYDTEKKSRFATKKETSWIRDFSRAQKGIRSVKELAALFKMDIFQDRIFVFTPDGDVKDLPVGATPIDFAYAVHTAVGNKCAGSRINGKIASLDSKLQNGDIVEIIKHNSAKPRADWLNFVKTEMARSQIRKSTKTNL